MNDPTAYYLFPHWPILKRRLLRVCVQGHGAGLQRRACPREAPDPAQEAELAALTPRVRGWLDRELLPELWSRRLGKGIALPPEEEGEGAAGTEEGLPESPPEPSPEGSSPEGSSPEESSEQHWATDPPDAAGWPGWAAALTLLGEPEALAKELRGSRSDTCGGEYTLVCGCRREEAGWRGFLYTALARYLAAARLAQLPGSESAERNRGRLEQEMRRLWRESAGEGSRSESRLVAAVALAYWEGRISLPCYDRPASLETVVRYFHRLLAEQRPEAGLDEAEAAYALGQYLRPEQLDLWRCIDGAAGLTAEERLVVLHKLKVAEPLFKTDRAFIAHHGWTSITFRRRWERARAKLAACINDGEECHE